MATKILLDEKSLREKAEACRTAGPVCRDALTGDWSVVDPKHSSIGTGGWGICVSDNNRLIVRFTGRDQKEKRHLADFVAAASPKAVLALLDEIDRLRKEAAK